MASTIVQSNEKVRVEIDLEAGGRLSSLAVAGSELLVSRKADPIGWGLYPMAPYAGRLRNGRFSYLGTEYRLPTTGDHAIHGTVLDRRWQAETDTTIVCDFGDSWPFDGFARQSILLTDDSLAIRLEVHTLEASMPASCGWHPWFLKRLGSAPARLDFQPGYMLVRDAAGITTATRSQPSAEPWDDCFGAVAQAPSIHWPGILSLSIESDCPYWVVYNEPKHALCVEPQTAPPDALNNQPSIVEPGHPVVAEMTLRWTIE